MTVAPSFDVSPKKERNRERNRERERERERMSLVMFVDEIAMD